MGLIWHLPEIVVRIKITYVKYLAGQMPRMLAVVVLIISETSRTLVSLFVGDRDWTQLGSEQLTHPS